MYVAASTRCFSDIPLSDTCDQIADLEFDKVELWLDEYTEHLKPAEIAAEPERFATRFRESHRLTVVAVSLENEVGLDVLAGLIRVVKLLRVTQITIPASPLGTPFNSEIDRLREMVELTSCEGIRLSIKTRTGSLTEDPHTAVELCQAVNGLGLTLDPSYYICGPNRGRSYDQVFPYVYHMHLRDSTPEELQVWVGSGEIDYSGLINQLQRANYNQALSIDLNPAGIDLEQRCLELRKLRMLLDTLL